MSYTIHRGPFCGCPGDADAYARVLKRILSGILVPGVRPELYYWKKSYDPGVTTGAVGDQFQIERTSHPGVDPVFILFGQTIGTPVRPPPEGWDEMRVWLDANGWTFIALLGEPDFQESSTVPSGKIPMSGTMYELFDAMRTGHETDLRLFDLSAFALAPAGMDEAQLQQQIAWRKRLLSELAKSNKPFEPRTETEFETEARRVLQQVFGAAPLDPRTDTLPGLEALSSDSPLLFGRSEDIARFDKRIFDDEERFTTVVGVSGAGKSSLLRAGLMGNWFRKRPMGEGLWHKAHAIVVEPDLLRQAVISPAAESAEILPDRDPLAALGEVLTTRAEDQILRVVGPFPEPLVGTAPDPGPASGDLGQDLASALDWWERLVGETTGPIVLIVDQAEQIEALARQQARDRAERENLPEVDPELTPEWARFTGLLALLSGQLVHGLVPDELIAPAEHLNQHHPVRLILGVHRLSTLDLWPLRAARPAPVTIEPIADEERFREMIGGTFALYQLTIDPDMLDQMVSEAAAIADENQNLQKVDGATARTVFSRASVLPQLVVTLQRLLMRWRELHGAGTTSDPVALHLDTETYGDLISIEGSIEALGEEAWASWQADAARHTQMNLSGFFSRQQFVDEQTRRFADLMSGLVDAQSGDRQDLTYLPRESDKAHRRADLIKALREHRLLTSTDLRFLRLPHRSILDHWPRAKAWFDDVKPRLAYKGALAEYYRKATSGTEDDRSNSWERWTEDELDGFTDLAFNWMGNGEGEDARIRDYLIDGLINRMDPTQVGFRAERRVDVLPFRAIGAGHSTLLERMAEWLVTAQLTQQQQGELLSSAAEMGLTKIVSALLAAGADPEQVDIASGTFPLLLAAEYGHTEVVVALIEAGAEPNQENYLDGTFPLLMAAQNGNADIVDALIKAGAPPSQFVTDDGNFPLLVAVQHKDATVVAILLDAGANPQQLNSHNGTFPLLIAAFYGHVDVVRLLIDAGATPAQVNARSGTFPLLIAAFNGPVEVVRTLIDAGAAHSETNTQDGFFPLLVAAQNGRAIEVAALLGAGASPNQHNTQTGSFPLLLAAQQGYAEVVAVLLDFGASPNQIQTKDGTFPLLIAAQMNYPVVVQALLKAGAPPDQSDLLGGGFPLLIAAQQGYVDVVTALLSAGASPNQVDAQDGRFPMLMAALEGNTAVVTTLLKFEAAHDQVHAQSGTFPLLLAAQEGHTQVVTTLLTAGASPNQVNTENGDFPLLIASKNGHKEVVSELLDAGAEPGLIHTASGATALSIAIVARRAAVLRLLLERGSSLNGLPPELREMAEQVLSGMLKPNEEPVQSKENGSEAELPRPPIPGVWQTPETNEITERQLNAVLHSFNLPSNFFKDLIDLRTLSNFGGTRTDLWYAVFALQLDDQVVAADLIWWDLPAPFGMQRLFSLGMQRLFSLFPGADITGVLVDLAPHGDPTIYWSQSEARKALASLVVLCQAGGYPIAEGDQLPFSPGITLPQNAYFEEDWRPWQTGSSPDGPTVQLPWIVGGDLVWGEVVVPDNGVGATMLPNFMTIVTNCSWSLPSYFLDQTNMPTPFRIIRESQ